MINFLTDKYVVDISLKLVIPIMEIDMIHNQQKSASECLQLELEESILNRQYTPGERLPSERKIMANFRVGRGTVREAYRALQQKGLIEIRQGGGAYVKEVDSASVGDTLSTLIRHRRISPQHLQEFREAIESRCSAYAAERATPDQIDELKQQLGKMESMLNSPDYGNGKFYELELNLHTQLAKISGNPMFEWLAATIERNAATFSEDLIGHPEKPEIALADWRNFIQAVENGETTKATMIIRAHIFRFGQFLEDLNRNKSENRPKNKKRRNDE